MFGAGAGTGRMRHPQSFLISRFIVAFDLLYDPLRCGRLFLCDVARRIRVEDWIVSSIHISVLGYWMEDGALQNILSQEPPHLRIIPPRAQVLQPHGGVEPLAGES